MRNAGFLILIGLVMLAGSAAYLLWAPPGTTVGSIVTKAIGGIPEAAKKEAPPPAPVQEAPKVEPRKTIRRAEKPAVVEEKVVAAEVLHPAPAPVPVRPPLPFPEAPQLSLGMERSKVLELFGKPAMKTTAMDRDRLLETYVYLRNEPNTATFVLFRDAKVVSANTSIY